MCTVLPWEVQHFATGARQSSRKSTCYQADGVSNITATRIHGTITLQRNYLDLEIMPGKFPKRTNTAIAKSLQLFFVHVHWER
jgi:hypothetical protein